MSSTITETERRSVPQTSAPELFPSGKHQALLKKREKLVRSTSIEKLRKFNSFICSQHYYILPSLLLWLKTSQTNLTANMEKCISYIKSMFLICTIRECLQDKVKTFDGNAKGHSFSFFAQIATKDITAILNLLLIRVNESLSLLYEDVKRAALVASIYAGVFLIFFQFIGCTILIFFKIPPIGFMFLVGCIMIMAHIAVQVMFQNVCQKIEKKMAPENNNSKPKNEENKRIRRQLSYIGKTISNVKLF